MPLLSRDRLHRRSVRGGPSEAPVIPLDAPEDLRRAGRRRIPGGRGPFRRLGPLRSPGESFRPAAVSFGAGVRTALQAFGRRSAQPGEEKAVAAFPGPELHHPRTDASEPGDEREIVHERRVEDEVRPLAQKGLDGVLVFFPGEGARAVDDEPPGTDKRRGPPEDRPLLRRQRFDRLRLKAPLDLRLSRERPEAAARRVDEHPVERRRRKVLQARRIFLPDDEGAEAEAGFFPFKKPHFMRVDVGGDDLPHVIHQLRDMGRLAAGGGAGVVHPKPRLEPHGPGDELSVPVLDREPPFGEKRF